jgi:hypothetical protein
MDEQDGQDKQFILPLQRRKETSGDVLAYLPIEKFKIEERG